MFHTSGGRKGIAGNGADGVGFEAVQATQVNRQAINRLAGNFLALGLFHAGGKLTNESDEKQESAGKGSLLK